MFEVNIPKTINAALYIGKRLGIVGFHRLFKILYFAEKEHIKKYGRPITGDNYIAMQYGPVPSHLYDLLKSIEGKEDKYFNVSEYIVKTLADPDIEELSESDIEAIEKSIAENRDLEFKKRTEKSHDEAWTRTPRNGKMSYEEIAKAAGVDSKMLEYMKYSSEARSTLK